MLISIKSALAAEPDHIILGPLRIRSLIIKINLNCHPNIKFQFSQNFRIFGVIWKKWIAFTSICYCILSRFRYTVARSCHEGLG